VKLHIAQSSGQNLFTGYGDGFVAVNGARHATHLLVTPDRIAHWNVEGFEALTADAVGELIAWGAEIIILGTGASLRFPQPELARRIAAAGIGLEVMDSKAACRTYNVLMAEGRRALAAILIE
jgi:uncharacterized protein